MDALATQVRTSLAAVTDVAVQVEPRMVPNPSPPTVDIYPADPSVDQRHAGFGELTGGEMFTVRARVSTADNDSGQNLLLAMMDDEGPLSLLVALTDEPTLGGVASDVDVRSRSGYVLVPDPGGEGTLLGCLWDVEVIKARS